MSLAKNGLTDDLYETDGYAWAEREAELLRQCRFGEIDLVNIIEEIESVGRSERRSLVSSYRLVIMHLLKWQYQPQRRSRSWFNTIGRERGTIVIDEKRNPSLARQPESIVADAYSVARNDAARETGLPPDVFPASCPYTIEQLRDPDWMPE